MRAFLLLIGVVVIGAVFCAISRPSHADFQAEMNRQLLAQIDATDTDDAKNTTEAMLITTCKLSRRKCADLIASLAKLDYRDQMFYATARVELGNAFKGDCLGIATKILCRKTN